MTTMAQPKRFPTDGGREHSRTRQVDAVPQLAETSMTVEARSAPRLQASLVPSITGVRLSPHGADATLLNISASGVLVECTSRFRLGTAVTVVFDGTFSSSSVEGRVARSSVATMDKNGVLRYHIGIAFNSRIALEEPPATANRQPETVPQPQVATLVPAVIGNRW